MHAPLILVTGSTDGIGRETARLLMTQGARVIVHGRDPKRTSLAASALGAVGHIVGDFSSLASVKAMAAALLERHPTLDVLINNAGTYQTERQLSADGFELTWAINHLAPFVLTHALLPALQRAPDARVVTVSSIAHSKGQFQRFDPRGQRAFDGYNTYADSKLANVLMTLEMARRLPLTAPNPVRFYAVHPGVVSTKLLRTGFQMEGPDSLAEGARTSVYCATAPELSTQSGGYYQKAQAARARANADDAHALYVSTCADTGVVPLPGA